MVSLAVVTTVAATACGPRVMTPREKALDGQLEASGKAAMPEGARLRKLTGHAQRGEEDDGFIVMLRADTCYVVVGIGEARIRAMDLLITSPTGAWMARTKEPEAQPVMHLCAKVSGPHRIGAEIKGRGDYVIGLFGPPDPETASSASAVASTSVTAPTPTARRMARCEAVGDSSSFHRRIAGEHRACASDADCITIKLDCGALECSGANREHRATYAAPLDCRGYAGQLATRDCDPQLGVETPRCREGCCVSVAN